MLMKVVCDVECDEIIVVDDVEDEFEVLMML